MRFQGFVVNPEERPKFRGLENRKLDAEACSVTPRAPAVVCAGQVIASMSRKREVANVFTIEATGS